MLVESELVLSGVLRLLAEGLPQVLAWQLVEGLPPILIADGSQTLGGMWLRLLIIFSK
jgi:hypothetical protein